MAFVGIAGDPPSTPKITMKALPAQPWYPHIPYPVFGGTQVSAPPAAPSVDPYPIIPVATAWPGKTYPLQWDATTGRFKP